MKARQVIFVGKSNPRKSHCTEYSLKLGYDVLSVESYEELTDTFKHLTNPVFFIDTDYNAHDAEAIKTQLELYKIFPLCVAISFSTDDKNINNIASLGYRDIISKPVSDEALKEKLELYASPVFDPNNEIYLDEYKVNNEIKYYNLDLLPIHDKSFANTIVKEFITETIQNVAIIQEAFYIQDWNTVRHISHKMKTHFLYFGAKRMAHLVERIETEAASAKNPEEIERLIRIGKNHYKLIINQIHDDFNLTSD